MTDITADTLHRTLKLEIDEGRAETVEEAQTLAQSYVLQIDVGERVEISPACQAAVLTAVNAGRRAFLGGVRLRIASNPQIKAGWGMGQSLAEAASDLGGEVVEDLGEDFVTLVIGGAEKTLKGSAVLFPTWHRWCGGVVEESQNRLEEGPASSLAAVLAAALAVGEAFRHVRGDPQAGRRGVGLSLWNPESDWRDADALGPEIAYLPSSAWILGLGHLGQAYCWTLGCLPYTNHQDLLLYLVDFDSVEEANESTGLLVDQSSVGSTKARAAARRLEELGVETRIVERPFDSHTRRTADEPSLALAGFDDPVPRRSLEGANFQRVIDAGLGARAEHYDEIQLHSFPSGLSASSAFPSESQATMARDQAAYRDLVERRMKAGESAGDAECGVLEISGRTVGAAFVGVVAATFVVAESLRILARGPRYQVIDLSLQSPKYREVVENEDPGPFVNVGYTRARQV